MAAALRHCLASAQNSVPATPTAISSARYAAAAQIPLTRPVSKSCAECQRPTDIDNPARFSGSRHSQPRPCPCAVSKLWRNPVSKLKIGTILDDKPVKLAIELPAHVNRDLIAYAEVLGREKGQTIEPAKLISRSWPASCQQTAHSRGLVERGERPINRIAHRFRPKLLP